MARGAARALGAYEALPDRAINALLRPGEPAIADPFVACAALSALAEQDDFRVVPALLSALQGPGLDRSPAHRPRAQAAAWALFDRAVSGQSDMFIPTSRVSPNKMWPPSRVPCSSPLAFIQGRRARRC